MRMEGVYKGKGLDRPADPPLGKLLVSRMPRTQLLRVTWPDGQYRSLVYDKNGDRKLIDLGIEEERLPKLLNYLWNFYHAYVEAPGSPCPPPPVSERPRQDPRR